MLPLYKNGNVSVRCPDSGGAVTLARLRAGLTQLQAAMQAHRLHYQEGGRKCYSKYIAAVIAMAT
jgi:hypothetical protein